MKDKDEPTEDKPELKDLSDFKHEEEGFQMFDFQKAREEKEKREEDESEDFPPKLKTKFCFKHGEDTFNFKLQPCGDNFDVIFIVTRYIDNPVMSGWIQQPVLDEHVELNKFEKFMNKIGFKRFTVERKIEIIAALLKTKIVKHLDGQDKAKELNRKFKL